MDTKSFFSLWYVRVLVILALVGVVVALASYAHLTLREARYVNTGPTTVTVRAEGEVLARPDIGQFSFAVRAEADDAVTAQDQSATAMNEIIAYLTDQEVAEEDIKTQNYNLNPQYRYEERVCPGDSYCPPGERIVDGYVVSQTVQVKVRNLDQAGSLISGVGERGATNISNLQFTIDDETNLKAEARDKAIAKAKEKAQKLADSLDVDIVRMIGYYEDEGRSPIYGAGDDAAMARTESLGAAPDTPVGENRITSNVNITYEIR